MTGFGQSPFGQAPWGDIALDEEFAFLQSVATFSAQATLVWQGLWDVDAVVTFSPDGCKELLGEGTMQAVVTFLADGDLRLPGAQEGETELQSVVTLLADGALTHTSEALMQVATTFDADGTLGAAPVDHEGEMALQLAAYVLFDADIHQPATGEWYIRGGSMYPPPLNRRRIMARSHLGTGRRIG